MSENLSRRALMGASLAAAATGVATGMTAGMAPGTAHAALPAQPTVWLTSGDLQRLAGEIVGTKKAMWKALVGDRIAADKALALDGFQVPSTWFVPWYYGSGDQNVAEEFRERGQAALRLALAHCLIGGSDSTLGWRARDLVLAWTAVTSFNQSEDSPLCWSNAFPQFIFAAEILRRYPQLWSSSDESRFVSLINRSAGMDTSAEANNWGSWGTSFCMAAGAYTNNSTLFDKGVTRWKQLFESQFQSNGLQPAEVVRAASGGPAGSRGICYSHFNLHALTIGAQIASLNGVSLFGYTNAAGATLGKAFSLAMKWTNDPNTFSQDTPYTLALSQHVDERYVGDGPGTQAYRFTVYSYGELLRTRFPTWYFDTCAAADRPMTYRWSGALLSLTHGPA